MEDDVTEADLISCVEFNHDGELLATGDKGGRVVIFQVLLFFNYTFVAFDSIGRDFRVKFQCFALRKSYTFYSRAV